MRRADRNCYQSVLQISFESKAGSSPPFCCS